MKYRITPLDPLISRDARPFGAGGRVRSLDWLTQPSVAGAVRTALWKELNDPDSEENLKALRSVRVRGPFPMLDGKFYFPRPLDIVISKKDGKDKIWQIKPRPIPDGCHVEMPLDGLLPAEPDTDEDFKPEKPKPFWTKELMVRWLENGKEGFTLEGEETLSAPNKDERVHVNIDPTTGTAKDGQLFSTTGLDFVHGNPEEGKKFQQGYAAVDLEIPNGLPALPEQFTAPLGGERRLVEIAKDGGHEDSWHCPLSREFHKGDKIRLVLASPAIFSQGWLPGWIDKTTLEGAISGTETRLKLISAVTGRWLPISGWSYEKGRTGPKPTQRMVPAGSVYFMELTSEAFNPASLWLSSVCDDPQARNDGFGLALWGRW